MLTRGAEAALLKTLEEPPEHVVFVLATTDPQKVSETIHSRVQHLQFHLLPMDDLAEYVRHVVADAGLEVDDAAVAWALEQGAGSARDTLSALELAASGGGDVDEPAALDELLEALVARDQGRALAAVTSAARQGRDPRTFAEDMVRTLRDAFLSLMAPELVHLPDARAAKVAAMAESLGAAAVVRAMETLGQTMVEMRHASDPRLLLDVAVVKLSSPAGPDGVEGLTVRITQLEQTVREMRERFASGSPLPPAPRDPTTGRARPGSRAGAAPAPRPVASVSSRPVADAPSPSPDPSPDVPSEPAPESLPVAASSQSHADPSSSPPPPSAGADPAMMWPRVLDGLKPLPRAIFKEGVVTGVVDSTVTVTLVSEGAVKGAGRYVGALETAIADVCGASFKVDLVARERSDDTASGGIARPGIVAEVAVDPAAPIDPNDITDEVPTVDPGIERLKNAFPGSRVVVEGEE
jgi:DNA polymerase-3 subunit gamma/tau